VLRTTVGAACARYDDRAAAYLLLQHCGVALDVKSGDVLEGLGRELLGRLRPAERDRCAGRRRRGRYTREVVAEPTGGQVMLCYGNLRSRSQERQSADWPNTPLGRARPT
jgi:hypothetical protein